MEILQFVRMEEIDPIFFETSYYVEPEQAVTRPYALLLEAMKETKYDALAKMTMHGREHIVILRPREKAIMLHTMYFMDELNQANEVAVEKPGKLDKKEADLAKRLIETLAGPFEPEKFHDGYRANVEELIEKKRRGQKITPIRQPKAAPVTDLLQALQKSLATSQKAAKPHSEAATAQKTTPKKSTRVA